MSTVTPGPEVSSLRRAALFTVIGSFSIAAFMGIAALLLGHSFGEIETKVLLTTLSVGVASLVVLACFTTLDSRFQTLGVASAAFALLPLAMALFLIWRPWDTEPSVDFAKWLGNAATIAGTLAQVCLLLKAGGDKRGLSVLLWGTIAMAVGMAAITIGLIMGVVDGDSWRIIGTVAILDVLGTVVVIALAVFGRRPAARTPKARSSLDPALLARLDVRAAESGRTREDLLQEAVRRFLDA